MVWAQLGYGAIHSYQRKEPNQNFGEMNTFNDRFLDLSAPDLCSLAWSSRKSSQALLFGKNKLARKYFYVEENSPNWMWNKNWPS